MTTHELNLTHNLRRLLSAWEARMPIEGEICARLMACHIELGAVVHDGGASVLLDVEPNAMNWRSETRANSTEPHRRARYRDSYPLPTVREFVRVHRTIDGSSHQCVVGQVLECDSNGWASVELKDGSLVEDLMIVSRLDSVSGESFYEIVRDERTWLIVEQATIREWGALDRPPEKQRRKASRQENPGEG